MNMILETYIEDKELFEGVSVALIEETMLMEAEIEMLEEGMAQDAKDKVRAVAEKQAVNVLKLVKATEQKERATKITAILKKLKSGAGSVISLSVRLLFLAVAAAGAAIATSFAMVSNAGVMQNAAAKVGTAFGSKSALGVANTIAGKSAAAVSAAKGAVGTAGAAVAKGAAAFGAKASAVGATAASTTPAAAGAAALAAAKGFSFKISAWILAKGGTGAAFAAPALYGKVVLFMITNPLAALGIYAAVLGLLIVGSVKIYKAAKAHGVAGKIAAAAVSLQQSVRGKMAKMVA